MTQKKVAILSTFYPYRGGIAQFSGALFRALESNCEVTAFNFSKQYPSFLFPGETQFVKAGDTADEIPSVRVLNSTSPRTYVKTANRINQFQPDVFISNYWMTFFGPAMGTVAKRVSTSTRKIAILHNVIPHEKRFYDRMSNLYFLNNHDGFVVLSEAVERDLLSIKPDAKFIRIPHPTYDHFGARWEKQQAQVHLGIDPSKKTLLFFGIIRDYKGLDILVEAFSKLSSEYQLLIAGECYGNFDKYQQLIESSGASDRIYVFNRYISDQEVAPFFSATDVCILPYKSATQSGITAIAHHFCVPLIATDVGGLKETIKHNENGLIIPFPEIDELLQAIQFYFEKGKYELFSKQLELENKENSWGNFAVKLLEFSSKLP